MNTNKKLKLNTKKVVILSDDQQNAVQGGKMALAPSEISCGQNTCRDCTRYCESFINQGC